MDTQTAARTVFGPQNASDLLDHALHHVEAYAPTGDLGYLRRGRKSWQEHEAQQLRFIHVRDHLGYGQFFLEDLCTQTRNIDTAPIIGNVDEQHPGAMARIHPQHSFLGFSCRCALGGRLETVTQ
jgi:hypothetical protein